MKIKFLKVRDVKSPAYGTSFSAGIDFFVPNEFPETTLEPHEAVSIPSGIKAVLPANTVLIAHNKSGVALKKRLQVGADTIDEDYRGEIHLHVYNTSNSPVTISPGEKILQIVLTPVIYADLQQINDEEFKAIPPTSRGEGGFGSTGTV